MRSPSTPIRRPLRRGNKRFRRGSDPATGFSIGTFLCAGGSIRLRWRPLPVASREYRHAPDRHVCRTDTSIRSGRQARSRALCTQDRPASPANPVKLPFGFPCWAFCWDSSRGRIGRATRHASVLSELSLSCVRQRHRLRIGTPRNGNADGGNDDSHEENRRVCRGEPIVGGCEAGKKPAQSASKQRPVNLTGTQWTLEEIGGKPVIEHSKATLAFLEEGRVSGNGSCNRFIGPAE